MSFTMKTTIQEYVDVKCGNAAPVKAEIDCD